MFDNKVEWLFEQVPTNTPVIITSLGKSFDSIAASITVMAGVNQLERDLIRMRQHEGIELAKKEGKFKGRLKKYHKNHAGMNYAVKLYKEGGMNRSDGFVQRSMKVIVKVAIEGGVPRNVPSHTFLVALELGKWRYQSQ
ncbi:hypothetical protein QFZ72_003310 [Bacillus sp. V2I10]|nr:hypothetical protein [Bacillus sp. V2I10]